MGFDSTSVKKQKTSLVSFYLSTCPNTRSCIFLTANLDFPRISKMNICFLIQRKIFIIKNLKSKKKITLLLY